MREGMSEEIMHEMERQSETVDFSKAQFDRIVAAREAGRPVEFEAFSPYIADYDMKDGKIWNDKLMPSDEVGLQVAAVLREKFPEARMVSLYDEYNTNMPDSAEYHGNPTRTATDEYGRHMADRHGNPLDAPQLALDQSVKDSFRDSIADLMRERGIIQPDDEAGKEFLLISENEKIKDAEQLVSRLEAAGHIKRDGQAITFVNDTVENPDYHEIPLRSKNGRWLCEALDASSYIDPQNTDITHVVVLPKSFEAQQDKVWEILRTLGIEPTNYHNVFFDETGDPAEISQSVREQIEQYE